MNNRLQTHTPKQAYLKSFTIKNVKCFKGEQTLDLSDSNGLPAQWTVILGDNNTDKIRLLRYLAKKYHASIYGYGTSRRMGESSFSESNHEDDTASLFSDDVTLINAEESLLQTDYAAKNGAKRAESRLAKIKQVLSCGLLPDVSYFRFTTTENLNSFVEVKTDYGWIRFSELG